MADKLGYEVGLIAGSVASAVVLGAPDLVILTLPEFADLARRITRSSSLSLMVDADHGYGNAMSVMRTVEEMEAAGVAALSIEDTRLPARFGVRVAEELIDVSEMLGKLRAAMRARSDKSFVLIARTRALRIAGVAECIERVKAYEQAGVDAISLMGARGIDELAAVHAATSLPLLIGSGSAQAERSVLAACGVRVASQGNLAFLAALRASYDTLKHLRDGRPPADLRDRIAAKELVGAATNEEEYLAWQAEFLSEPS